MDIGQAFKPTVGHGGNVGCVLPPLFIVNNDGVPSVVPTVQVGP